MPTINDNQNMWSNYDWSQAGDEWSDHWGSTQNLWDNTILPRIKDFVPTGHILEIAPGFGRITQFLIPLCEEISIVDLTERCIQNCKERFQDVSHISYYVNDGKSLSMIDDESIDFVLSWDSLVHADSEVMRAYIAELSRKLKPDGTGFLHHSNIAVYNKTFSKKLPPNIENPGWRGNMSAKLFRLCCKKFGMQCIRQEIHSWGRTDGILSDCFSTFIKSRVPKIKTEVITNKDFLNEIEASNKPL